VQARNCTTVKAYEQKGKRTQFAVTWFVNERYIEQLRPQSTKSFLTEQVFPSMGLSALTSLLNPD